MTSNVVIRISIWSAKDFFDHAACLNTGQAVIQALVRKGETLVVDSQLMKHRRVEVANVDWIFGDVVAEVIGLTVADTALDAAAGHPSGETTRVMVATVVVPIRIALGISRASEFSRAHDQRIFQQTALLEVFQETRNRLIDIPGLSS